MTAVGDYFLQKLKLDEEVPKPPNSLLAVFKSLTSNQLVPFQDSVLL
jgi:hypothetical protein